MTPTDTFLSSLKTLWESIEQELLSDAKIKLSERMLLDLSKPFDIETTNSFGVYLLSIKNEDGTITSGSFLEAWNSTQIGFSSRPINKRSQNTVIGGYQAIYIGKSAKLKSRINEHCFQKKESSTYGTKLMYRHEVLVKYPLYLSYYCIDNFIKIGDPYKQFIITNLESKLRDEYYKPWIGKQ
ncbi:MAG: hypothetical protein CFE24_15050 [Flavobacterium sp. BFFFF2]|nr:MAG: hypothetical protein CFE24_15050 [Flavobacterium sp. BFFFF2]